jgi:hypothetical protein
VVLAYTETQQKKENGTANGGVSTRRNFFFSFSFFWGEPLTGIFLHTPQTPQRPELRIITRTNEEISSDELSIKEYEHYKCNNYRLAHAPSGLDFPLSFSLLL